MDSMDLDIDMDVDVDFVPDEPIAPELIADETRDDRSDGEVAEEPDVLAPTKVHIRGLDVLKPDDIKAYVAEHFAESPFERIEWIDDSSANLLFESEPIAARALEALAAEPIQDVAILPLKQNLPARPYTQMPDVKLQVRLAVVSDKKQAGAAQRSRFYLLNPEFDPEERRRQRGDYSSSNRRYRERDGDGRHHRHSYSYSHQYDRNRRRRRYSQDDDDDPPNHFDVSLYDDDEASRAGRAGRPQPTHRRRRSYTPDSERSVGGGDYYRGDNRGKELFPDNGGASNGGRRGSHRRDRTRSPARRDRDGDRDMDLDGDEPRDHYRESSTRNNRDRARALKSHMARNSNRDKELFPGKELFPDKTGSGGGGGGSGGGRLGDTANTEDPAELLAKGITLPLMDETDDVDPAARTATKSRRLEDRITAPGRGGGNGNGGGGKLADRIMRTGDTAASSGSSSFNIRGTAGGAGQSRGPASQNQGFAIKGSAGKSVRELFPDKFGGGAGEDGGGGDAMNGRNGNAGKELFADRIGGRARTRQRAGDLFD